MELIKGLENDKSGEITKKIETKKPNKYLIWYS